MSSSFRKHAGTAAAFLSLGAFWLICCFNVLLNFRTQLYELGIGLDAFGMLWMSWWAQISFLDWSNFYHCPMINYPIGGPVFIQDVAWLHAALSALFRPIFGPIGAINAIFVGEVLFSFFGVYYFLTRFTDSKLFATLFTILISIQLYQVNVGHLDLALADFGLIAFTLGAYLNFRSRPTMKKALITIFLGGITCLAEMYYGIALLGFLTFASFLPPIEQDLHADSGEKAIASKKYFPALILLSTLALAVFLLLPSILLFLDVKPMAGAVLPFSWTGCADKRTFSTHLLSTKVLLLSLTGLSLLCWWGKKKSRYVWVWCLTTATLLLMAQEPGIKISSDPDVCLPAPVYLAQHLLPFLWRMAFPARYAKISLLFLGGLIALIFQSRNRQGYPSKIRVLRMALLLVVFHVLAPIFMGGNPTVMPPNFVFESKDVRPPRPFIVNLGKSGEREPIFALSCHDEDRGYNAWDQIFHQRPMAGYPIMPPNQFNYFDFGALSTGSKWVLDFCNDLFIDGDRFVPDPRDVAGLGYRYYFIYSSALRRFDKEDRSDHLAKFGKPVFASRNLIVYDLKKWMTSGG